MMQSFTTVTEAESDPVGGAGVGPSIYSAHRFVMLKILSGDGDAGLDEVEFCIF